MSGYQSFPSFLPTPHIPVFRGQFSSKDFWQQKRAKELVPWRGGVGAMGFGIHETYDGLSQKPLT